MTEQRDFQNVLDEMERQARDAGDHRLYMNIFGVSQRARYMPREVVWDRLSGDITAELVDYEKRFIDQDSLPEWFNEVLRIWRGSEF